MFPLFRAPPKGPTPRAGLYDPKNLGKPKGVEETPKEPRGRPTTRRKTGAKRPPKKRVKPQLKPKGSPPPG